jgi:hypothetical protein
LAAPLAATHSAVRQTSHKRCMAILPPARRARHYLLIDL